MRKLRRKRKNEGRNRSFICVTAVNPKSGWLKLQQTQKGSPIDLNVGKLYHLGKKCVAINLGKYPKN